MIEFKIEDHVQVNVEQRPDKNGRKVHHTRRSRSKTLRVRHDKSEWKPLKSKDGQIYFASAARANDRIHDYMKDKIKPGMGYAHVHWRTLII